VTSEELDPRFIAARSVLLDALLALEAHASAVVVAGAQAIYLRTGDADFGVSPFTLDSDLAINPSLLGDDPTLEQAMRSASFEHAVLAQGNVEPGIWVKPVRILGKSELIPVDLIVPNGFAPAVGRRGARLGTHGNRAALKLTGLEAALVDNSPMSIASFDSQDTRVLSAAVAGPAALLVAKSHKLHDRVEEGKAHRVKDKDASDVVRLMQTSSPDKLAPIFRALIEDPRSSAPSRSGLDYLRDLFGRRGATGIRMAGSALELAMPVETVEVICTAFVTGLTEALGT
jgi:hypothetical protein